MHTAPCIAYGGTDTGRHRVHNEDRFFCDAEAGIFLVVDGMGGHVSGDVAAEIASMHIVAQLQQRTGSAEARLRHAITEANNAIVRRTQIDPLHFGMACVLTAVVLENGFVTVGHVGDTRLYEIRTDGIRKVTRDHSPVGVQEDCGILTEIEAMSHPRRGEVLRDVGSMLHKPYDEDFIDIYTLTFDPAGALLLCTDGVSDLIPQVCIRQIVQEHAGRPEGAVNTIIELANEVGGHDNITAVIVEGPAFARAVADRSAASELPQHSGLVGGPDHMRRSVRSRVSALFHGWFRRRLPEPASTSIWTWEGTHAGS